MTWECDRCGTRYPDTGGERGEGCLSCTEIVSTTAFKQLEDLIDEFEADRDIEDDYTRGYYRALLMVRTMFQEACDN